MNEMILWIAATLSSALIGALIGNFLKEKRHHRALLALFNSFSGRNSELANKLGEAEAFIESLREQNRALEQGWDQCNRDREEARQELGRVQHNFDLISSDYNRLLQDKRHLINDLHSAKADLEDARESAAAYFEMLSNLGSDHNKRMRTRGARAAGKKLRTKHAKELEGAEAEARSYEAMAQRFARRLQVHKEAVTFALANRVRLAGVRNALYQCINERYEAQTREKVMNND